MKKPKNKRHKKRRNINNCNQHQQNLQQPQQQQSDNPKTVHTFSVYITTWNVSSRYPESVTVHQLLGLGSTPDPNEQLPDFYVIGWVVDYLFVRVHSIGSKFVQKLRLSIIAIIVDRK